LAYFPMNEGQGQVVGDFSEYKNDALITGEPEWVQGRFGRCLRFDGAVSEVNAPQIDYYKAIYPRYNATVMAHFKREGTPRGRYECIISTHWKDLILAFKPDNKINLCESTWLFSNGPVVEDNDWHHIAVVLDRGAGTWKMYYDGNLVDVASIGLVCYMAGVCIGNRIRSYKTMWFKGLIDDVAIIERSLSDEEVAYYANAPLVGVSNEGDDAIVITNAYDADSAPDTVMVIAEDAGNVSYEVSRDDGVTWTAANKNEETDISAQPEGTKMRVKAIIPNGSVLDNIALIWS